MPIKRRLAMTLPLWSGLALLPTVSQAKLAVGDAAPDFATDAAIAGKDFRFQLSTALKTGPVVLYFYPKAFTSGCTLEAHLFAEASDRFAALDTTVVGMSRDDIGTLKRFSVEACRNRFAVGADADGRITRLYDAAMMLIPGMADRISYVISTGSKVVELHHGSDPEDHVTVTLKAAEALHARAKR